GDGAGALVLEAAEQPGCGVVSTVLGCRGDAEHLLSIEAGGSARPATRETAARGEHYVRMKGGEVFRLAVRAMSQAAREALDRAGLTVADVRMAIAHQANARILGAVREALGLPAEKVFLNLDRYGNTAAASIPIALSEFLSRDAVAAGDHLLLAAFGGGLTWAAAVVRWPDVGAILRGRGKREGCGILEPDGEADVLPVARPGRLPFTPAAADWRPAAG
ncbi:MAG TPA: 3-oxoacyl-[acyl-carrier-protein] synthase III C-terminal domain-containing protein, partial [Gemmataceae bacterium]|nr:3-oxoacyl-[acyl-carrier-protein] synthase III C-terminal domain-containing protein [Gemmataceae bacterium]